MPAIIEASDSIHIRGASSPPANAWWRIVVCNDDHDLTPVDPPVVIDQVKAGSLSGRRPQSAAGTMTLALPIDMAQVDEIRADRVLRFDQWDPEPGNWAPFFAAYPRRVKPVLAAPGGAGARIATWVCTGIGSDFDATVVHARNSPAVPFGPKRAFDWRTPELDTSTWAAPHGRALQGDKTATPPLGYAGIPRNSPNPLAQLIWGQAPVDGDHDPVGFCIFDSHFTLTETSLVHVYPLGDDLYDVALAGESVMQFTDRNGTGFHPDYRPLRLEPGTYTVRALVENVDRPENPTNSGVFCLAIGRDTTEEIYGADRHTEEWIRVTAVAGWKTLAYPELMPGFTFGHRFKILFDESQARGEIPGWAIDFDEFVDSAGAEWPVSQGNIYDVLCSLTDVLNKDAEEGWIDWVADPAAKVLHAYVHQGFTVLGAAMFVGEQITDLATDEDLTPSVTGLEVGWRGGYFTAGDPPRRAGFSTDAETLDEAQRLSIAQLVRLDPAAQKSVTVGIDPMDRRTIPGLGFDLGDSIPFSMGMLRARAFSWKVDGRRILWVPEFETLRQEEADRQARIAKRLLPGSLSGRSETVAPTTPLQPAGGTLGAEVLTWGTDSSLEGSLPPQSLMAEGRVHHVRIIAGEHPPIGGTLTWWLQVNGIDTFGPFTLAQGPPLTGDDTIDSIPQEHESTALVIHGGPTIQFAPNITHGSGHGKLTFELTASPYP